MHDMTTMTVLQVAGIVEGAERLVQEISQNGVTKANFTAVLSDRLMKAMADLRGVPNIQDVSYAPLLRRKQEVYGRMSALMTTYNAICASR